MKSKREKVLESWGVPAAKERMENLLLLAARQKVAEHALQALDSGIFMDGRGHSEPLGLVRNPVEQVALIAWLAASCQTKLSLEVGFGMGITAAIILASRLQKQTPFEHRIFDPYGLPDGAGFIAQRFLQDECGEHFRRLEMRSQFGMAAIASAKDPEQTGFVMIDGDHRVDAVFADFYLADALMAIGGYMVLDDACYAPVETVVRFVMNNRSDYEVSYLEIPNTAVFRKVGEDERPWNHFRTFSVPKKNNWEPSKGGVFRPR